MMNSLHKRQENIDQKVDFKEGERRRLCSNSVEGRSPSLDFNPNDPIVSDNMLIDYLASILVEGFLEQENHGDSQ
jgi:hypothetical protein